MYVPLCKYVYLKNVMQSYTNNFKLHYIVQSPLEVDDAWASDEIEEEIEIALES